MGIRQAVFSILSGDAGVSALVAGRIFPHILPQSPVFPAVTFSKVSVGRRDLTLNGFANVAEPTFRIACFATDPLQLDNLVNSVRSSLQGYRGTVASTFIMSARVVNEVDLQGDVANLIFQTVLDVRIAHRES